MQSEPLLGNRPRPATAEVVVSPIAKATTRFGRTQGQNRYFPKDTRWKDNKGDVGAPQCVDLLLLPRSLRSFHPHARLGEEPALMGFQRPSLKPPLHLRLCACYNCFLPGTC